MRLPPDQEEAVRLRVDNPHGKVTLYRNRKGAILIADYDSTGQGQVVVQKNGESEYIGCGPVDKKKWEPVTIEWTLLGLFN